ncbi:hypothetical protein BRARA_H00041 [Brassica rapa]|uniref:Chloride channel protein n=1 Tax=Brassica campestris TaxID=3711 RepID=A0A397Y7L7_BRACM|nr:hypothetical protein BRARA_H00041 [Brassica rapa]
MSSGGEYNEDRHLLRSTDGDEVVNGRGEGDLDVESQSPAIRNSTGGVRNLLKHLDRRFSLSGRRLSFKRLENIRVDRSHHHPSSSSPLSAAGEEDGVDDRDDEYGFDEGNDVLGDSAPPEWALLLIGCLIGVAAGICVAGFNKGVHVIHEWSWAGTPNEGAAWLRLQRLADTWHRILLIPVTGGVIVGMMHGLLEILDQIRQSTSSQGQGVDLLAGIFPVIKAIQAAVTLGTGCSLGPEGPSVDIGKSCANGFALMMENNRERRIALTAAGAASGIASGFNAAVAGCFFAIETVLRPLLPLTSVLLLFELTKDYRILLPLMGAVGLAIWVPSVVNQDKESDSSEGRNAGRGYSTLSPSHLKTEGIWRRTDNANSLELTVMENPDHKSFLDEETILDDLKVLRVMPKNYVKVCLGTTLREARNILKDSHQNCLVVVDEDDFLAGILTHGDIRRCLSNKVSPIVDENTCTVSSVCTKKITYRGQERGLITCYPDTTVGVAKELMEARGVKQLPVVKRGEVSHKGKKRKLLGLLHYDSIWTFLRDEMSRRRSINERRKDKYEEVGAANVH